MTTVRAIIRRIVVTLRHQIRIRFFMSSVMCEILEFGFAPNAEIVVCCGISYFH